MSRWGGKGDVAAICRDEQGNFLGASSVLVNNIEDPETLEEMAFREAMALSNDQHVQKISIALDCKNVVEEVRKGSSSSYGAIVLEIKESSRAFISCIFLHEFRNRGTQARKTYVITWTGCHV